MEDKSIEFLRGQTLAGFFEEKIKALDRPFSGRGGLTDFLIRLSDSVVSGAERLLGQQVYIKKIISLIDRLPPQFHRVVGRLAEDGQLKNCLYPEPSPDWPKIPAVQFISEGGIKSSGYALDYGTAAAKALAEFFEWDAFRKCDSGNIIFGSWKELRHKNAIDPRRFICFSDAQQEEPAQSLRNKYNDRSKLGWVAGVSFLDGKPCLVPAQLVYWEYGKSLSEPVFQHTTSNGGAAGTSRAMVFSRAILEVIERDAIMIHWLNKITPPKIDLSSARGHCRKEVIVLLDLFQKYSIDLALLDITTDIGVPVVLAAVRSVSPGLPAVVLGAGADLDIESAILHALFEGIRAGFFGSVAEEEIKTVRQNAADIDTITKRKTYWYDRALLPEVDFLFSGPIKKISLTDKFREKSYREKLNTLRDILARHDLDTYLVDATSQIAKDAGLIVGRALIPDLYPLYLNEHFKYLGVKRLYDAPVRMGIFKNPKREEDINSLPHPFL